MNDHKEKLKGIRDFYKPINRLEMNQWKKEYSERKKELTINKQLERERHQSEIKEHQQSLAYKPNLELRRANAEEENEKHIIREKLVKK